MTNKHQTKKTVPHPCKYLKTRPRHGLKFISLIALFSIRYCMAFHAYGRPKEDEVPTERKLKSKYHCSSEEMPVQQGP